jgi:HTH-type transcriptional regulator/antitoxin HipB
MSLPILTAAQVGRLLQTARKAKGLSQQQIADQLGLSQKRISALELSPGDLSVDQLLAFCASVGLELAIQPKHDASHASAPATDW